MIPTIRIVTPDPGVADRYAVALAPANCRHTPHWRRADLDGVDVVLFDPGAVDRSMVAAGRQGRDRPYRAVEMGVDFESTIGRVERAADKRRFEAAIDARFDALSDGCGGPTVTVPESLEAAGFGDFYETV